MVAGGAESPVNRIGVAGFAACRALSTGFNDRPEAGSRPYDRDRDGFVMGEGAGCVVLESYEHAKARGAHIYAELIGYGMSGDAYHITAPAPDGDGAYRCMSIGAEARGHFRRRRRLRQRAWHLDAARRRDRAERRAAAARQYRAEAVHVVDQIGDRPSARRGRARSRRSTRFSRCAIRSRRRPAISTIHRSKTAIDLVPHVARTRKIDVVLSNSFGFGGTNASLVFRRAD